MKLLLKLISRNYKYLSLFRPEDVTKTMYESMYCNDAKLPSSSDKVDSVCDLLLKSMSQDKEKYILPIISCHVKSSKSKIDDALLEIKSLKSK